MGSVKDLKVLNPPQKDTLGRGHFIFSDRYSVFDWGEMPDHIPHKGEVICLLSAYFFEKIEAEGINTHYRGVIEDGSLKNVNELNGPVSEFEVDLVRVIKPDYSNGEYDYSIYNSDTANCLLPLEIIYRNTLPEHSSFRKRAEKGEVDLGSYGLSELPTPGVKIEPPIFDVSTKLEASDRYISWEEAQKIASVSDQELKEIKELLLKVNQIISSETEKVGIQNVDGKIELGIDNKRNIMIVDAVGTPDECRFALGNHSISKEAIRKYYRTTDWFKELNEVNKEEPNWHSKINLDPPALDKQILELISQMYMACANQITGRKWFSDIPSLDKICSGLNEIIS